MIPKSDSLGSVLLIGTVVIFVFGIIATFCVRRKTIRDNQPDTKDIQEAIKSLLQVENRIIIGDNGWVDPQADDSFFEDWKSKLSKAENPETVAELLMTFEQQILCERLGNGFLSKRVEWYNTLKSPALKTP
eukprot:UN05546